ncbi:phage antirepressor KilAC domain protein [Burkholderia pseudomallei]|uniref:BRO family, N-terminal domain protein n=1 Tax=Burkholderia pseudomallei (strain 1710b) TaxID=320372 RepID=Q3JTQ5_BURP1|nr:BRO family protein [Burkholderia pseudomallei]ABA48731.1 BRO family, N-terminal domain protein [Burkholderia pseudomallei 1710b]AIS47458.1 phage antirepressor KilAC domain protein [Burkholderia pseudomallei]KGD19663.1 phage antirepressor KilAC domain protein [Burkholderia pseudomallei]CAJ4994009.1 BRO domain-containing protein [Burkholderia pseudomallei]CAJ5325645.1 BRO domain-containing protein [Burkholderia pseudomallei]
MSDLTLFKFEGRNLRTVKINGDPWFVAKDVCDVLGITNPSDALTALDDDEKASFNLGLRGSAPRVVSESGLYALIMRSRKPQARAFRKWVTSVVLPAIRKDGSYVMGEEKVATGEMDEAELMARAMIAANNKIERLQTQIAANAPKVDFYETHTAPRGNMGFREFAKTLGVYERDLRAFLSPEYLVKLRADGGSVRVAPKYRSFGWFATVPGKVVITPAGRRALAERFYAGKQARALAA